MKKRIFLAALTCLFVCAAAYAGKDIEVISGSIHDLKDPTARIVVAWDYSSCLIEKKPVDQFLKEKGADWVRDYPGEIAASEAAFAVRFNKKNKKFALITDDADEAQYKMIIYVDKFHYGSTGASVVFGGGLFTRKVGGASSEGQIELYNNQTGELLATLNFDCQGESGLTNEARRSNAYIDFAENLSKAISKASATGKEAVSLNRKGSKGSAAPKAKTSAAKTAAATGTAAATAASGAAKATGGAAAKAKKGAAAKKAANKASESVAEEKVVAKKVSEDKPAAMKRTNAVLDEDEEEEEVKPAPKPAAKPAAKSHAKPAAVKKTSASVPATVLNAESDLALSKGFGGSVAELKNQRRMSLYLDFSDALIDNKSEEDFIQYMRTSAREKDLDPRFDRTWEQSVKPQLTSLILEQVNEELDDEDQTVRLTTKQGEAYTLKVVVEKLTGKGENKCDYLVVETATGEVIAHYQMEADGGRIGRIVGLFEQGFKEAGKKFGRTFARNIKRAK